MAEDFSCDNCGRSFPADQMKEVFEDADGREVKQRLCPTCLDDRMNTARDVYGVEGDEKRRAAYVADERTDVPSREVTGRRGE